MTQFTISIANWSVINELIVPKLAFQIFPNLSDESFVIDYNLSENAVVIIMLYDILGKKITLKSEENQSSGAHQFRIATISLQQGIYFCNLIVNGQAQESKKLVIIH